MMQGDIQFLWVLACILGNPCECTRELQHGSSRIQYGHRLDSRTIDTYGGVSFLDCVKECLVTTRCKSINYHKGANYCETNYEDQTSATNKFMKKSGWVYIERGDWPEALVGPCASYNCSLNQKCRHNKYSKDMLFDCILSDCGIPVKYGVDFDNTQQGDAIALNRRMHASCSAGFEQHWPGRLICRSSGEWDYRITCVEKDWLHYDGHVYSIFQQRRNWTEAKVDCESREAYLAEIGSYEEDEWIHRRLIDSYATTQCNSDDLRCGVWIGGEKDLNNFRWSGSGRPLEYTNWTEDKPDDHNNNEDCIEVIDNGKWNDFTCTQSLPYICEKSTDFRFQERCCDN